MTALHSAASERNRGPILEVLRGVLPERGVVLEIASGPGMHAVHFASALPGLFWQPTDIDEASLASIEAWREAEGTENLLPAVRLDVTHSRWPVEHADAIFSANMTQATPWACSVGLLAGAGRLLAPGAPVILYGPFKLDGQHTAESNERFDQSLRERDSSWGVRCATELTAVAREHGLTLERRVPMPAENLCLVFRR